MKKSWFFIVRYPLVCKPGEYKEIQSHVYLTSKELEIELKMCAQNTYYTGIIIMQLKDTGKIVQRKALAKKYFPMKLSR